MALNDSDLDACLRVLAALAEDRALLAALDEQKRRLLIALAGRVALPARVDRKRLVKEFRRRERAEERAHDAGVLERARNRSGRKRPTFILPAATAGEAQPAPAEAAPDLLLRARACYICKESYRRVHHFYDSLCPPCAELNWQKRHQSVRLDGRVALVTGARIKIGYQAALLLLRAGAQVIATTRFPRDAAQRFAREPDFAGFRDRLRIHGIDLCDVPAVERLTAELARTLDRLDVIINNAAQTVRRPAAFYQHLRDGERQQLAPSVRPLLAAPEETETETRDGLVHAASSERARASLEDAKHFPAGQLDLDEQQIDLRAHNSWRLTLAEVPTVELLEVHLVNAVAPFILNSRLKPVMLRHPTGEQHIVNVSAMEAKFSRGKKTERHPHTNMAKAALNMMTRTSAADYAQDGIFMNSVDTGWVTDEDPLHHAARKQAVHDFHPPLDAIDGAARVLDPLFVGLATGEHSYGLFWKDYRPTTW